jgi:hypothetical protein
LIVLGRNASALFPNIVKLVASSQPELKKLVYVYLERYAEEQQDLALLSISTFQRGLKDHNQVNEITICHGSSENLADQRMCSPSYVFNTSTNHFADPTSGHFRGIN